MLADSAKYYVVELSDNHLVPKVLAAPTRDEVNEEPPPEMFDFTRHYMGKWSGLLSPHAPFISLPCGQRTTMTPVPLSVAGILRTLCCAALCHAGVVS